MSANAIAPLARLARYQFQSFSEAAGTVLEMLVPLFPDSKVVVGQLDHDEGAYRIVDARGAGMPAIEAGSILPAQRAGAAGANRTSKGAPERWSLSLDTPHSVLTAPLETGHGRQVGALCAVTARLGAYGELHDDLLAITARLLAHEWERVMWAADMLKLSDQLRDPERTDPVTGLLNRESFHEVAERERRLALDGTGQRYLVVVSVSGLDAVRARYGQPMADLLLKEAGATVTGAIRQSDHAGRVGGDVLAAVLRDCRGPDGADAFCDRLATALRRVMRERPESVDAALATLPLGAYASSEEALLAAAPDASSRAAARWAASAT